MTTRHLHKVGLAWLGYGQGHHRLNEEENGVMNSLPHLLLLFSGRGETLENFQARFPGTMRAEKQLLYWNKGQNDTSTEANQTTR